MIAGINWLLSDRSHRYTIVIAAEYVNRRVKSEFNTIYKQTSSLKCTPGFKYAFIGKCG